MTQVRPVSRPSMGRSPCLPLAVVLFAALASLATPAPRQVRNYPSWVVLEDASSRRDFHGLVVGSWVSKSGKHGLGLSLELDNRRAQRVDFSVARATLLLGEQQIPSAATQLSLEPATQGRLYLPFLFDNEAAWNSGLREAELNLVLQLDDTELTWKLPLRHVLEGFHRDREETECLP